VTFEDGQAQTDLTGDAARAQQRTNRLLASNPAAESLSDIDIGDGDASVTEDAQRDFEREQTVEQTIEQSPFADEPDDVATTVTEDGDDDFDAVAELTGDAEAQTQDLLSNDPAADTLGDIDIGDGTASVETEAERQFQSQQRDRLRDFVFSQPDSASVPPIDDPPARETETESEQLADAEQAETRASVSRFGQQQLDAQRSSEVFGDVAIENPLTGNRVEDDLQTAADEFQESGEFALANLGRVQPTPVTTGVGGTRTADEVDDGVRGAAADSSRRSTRPPLLRRRKRLLSS